MKKILMATDLSSRCDRALQRAVALAEQFGAQLRVLHVVQEAFLEAMTAQQVSIARKAIEEQIAAINKSESANVEPHIIRGLDYEDIIREAESYHADLIVLGIHRHQRPELFQGTTIERVVRYGSTPVLMVKNTVTGPYRKALVGVDLSDQAKAALRHAARLTSGGVVQLIHVAHRPFVGFLSRDTQNRAVREQGEQISSVIDDWIKEVSEQLGEKRPQFETLLRDGIVAATVRENAEALKSDLLTIGTHGRTGISHAIVGSVAEDLLASAPCDVLVVRDSSQ